MLCSFISVTLSIPFRLDDDDQMFSWLVSLEYSEWFCTDLSAMFKPRIWYKCAIHYPFAGTDMES
jgi:hypothetical protein